MNFVTKVQEQENILRRNEGNPAMLVEDGQAGTKTWEAVSGRYDKLVGVTPAPLPPPVQNGDYTSTRSEAVIATLDPFAQSYFRSLFHLANKSLNTTNIKFDWLSGTRSFEEQQKLYDAYQNGGPKAAPPGDSFHNFGGGADGGFFSMSGQYLDEHPEIVTPAELEQLYKTLAELGESIGLVAGIHFGDNDHFELYPPTLAAMGHDDPILAAMRGRRANGLPLYP